MGSYKTKQGDELRGYLERMPGRHITAGDICEYFRQSGKPIGMATVYRQLERMVDEDSSPNTTSTSIPPPALSTWGHTWARRPATTANAACAAS